MSDKKKNYRAMYNNQPDPAIPEVTSIAPMEEVVVEETPDAVVLMGPIEVVEPAAEEPTCEFVIGTVVGCSRLNVREAPETMAEVICTIPVWSEVQICTSHEYDMWYHVYTAAGQEGYCMKQFIEIN